MNLPTVSPASEVNSDSSRLKVLHVITHLGVGGAQDNTLLTIRGLSRRRYRVDLASGPRGRWCERGRQYADQFYPINHLRQDRGDIDPPADARALVELTQLMRREQYDIVHTHSSKAGMLGRVAATLARTPIIVHTVHGFPFNDYMNPLRRQFYILSERVAAGLCDILIAVCDTNRAEAVSLGLAPYSKIVTIPSGIDLDHFRTTVDRASKCLALGLDPNRPIVGTVGRLSEQKAPQDFVKAAQSVLSQHPDVQFVLVGGGPLRAQVEAMIGGDTRIKVLGYRDDVPEILLIFDIFVLTSWWEGLGRALTEAMIARRPVVATAVNGVPDLVTPGETGLLSPPRDPKSLAQNIVRLLQNPTEAKQYGENGYRRVVPAFGAECMVNQIAALYARLIEEKNYRRVQS